MEPQLDGVSPSAGADYSGIVRIQTIVSRGFGVNPVGSPISEPNWTFGHKRPIIGLMPDPRTLAETESAMNRHIEGLEIDFAAAHTVSSIYRAANAIRAHITNAVLPPVRPDLERLRCLWVVWIWDGMETRHVAESAAISKER